LVHARQTAAQEFGPRAAIEIAPREERRLGELSALIRICALTFTRFR